MENTFTKAFVLKVLFEAVVIGLFVWGIQFFFENKYKPITASEVLKRENFLNAKKNAYFEAIDIANKVMANLDYGSIDANTGNKIASEFLHKHPQDLSSFELEINSAYSKMMIFTSDTNILTSYFRIFVTPPTEKHIPIIEMRKFIVAIRKDLGNTEELPIEYKMLYIVMPSQQDSLP
ncbi:MAG: hypothetical protein NTU98_09395 [Bacteroidetes bacterium]|nr:hypothetical protein [Bacteroidota bacterium]